MAVSWLRNGGDPNHLLTGMILQVQLVGGLGVGGVFQGCSVRCIPNMLGPTKTLLVGGFSPFEKY